MEKKFNFVYLTTNLINKKQYIGDHSTNNLEKDNYLGSGNYVINAIKKCKKENFKREILEFFPTKKEAFDAQEKYINEYNTLSPNGYNLDLRGGTVLKGEQSEETRKKKSNSMKGKKQSKETCRRKSESMKGKNKGKQPWLGKHHTEETLQKMKKPKSEEHKEKLRIAQTGKKDSEETKRKKSESNKGKHSEKGIQAGEKHPMFGKHHKKESKQLMRNAKLGKHQTKEHIRKRSEALKGRPGPNKGLTQSEESNRKRSKTQTGKKRGKYKTCGKYVKHKEGPRIIVKYSIKTCSHCNKEIAINNFKRWHGDNCKMKLLII